MKILLMEFDLFQSTGGGQTVYQNIIKFRKEDHFFYFIKNEPLDLERPKNVTPIPYRRLYYVTSHWLLDFNELYPELVTAINCAASIQNFLENSDNYFDIIDTPDYYLYGIFIKMTLEYFGIKSGKVVLALHGNISDTLKTNWPGGDHSKTIKTIKRKEIMQFANVDSRYAISDSYTDYWQQLISFPVKVIDPLSVITLTPAISLYEKKIDRSPDLYFIGRCEKRKGPDLFIDLVWWINKELYHKAHIVGGESKNLDNIGAETFIEKCKKYRQVEVEFHEQKSPLELQEIFKQKSLIILPSRLDQFNLIVLEALSLGCPVVVSEQAGVSRFMKEHYPNIPFSSIDLSCSRMASKKLKKFYLIMINIVIIFLRY